MNQKNALEVLKKLITYPTITPNECGIYEFIRAELPYFEVLEINEGGVKNLFLFKRFGAMQEQNIGSKNQHKKPFHICFSGHIDVVPPGEGWIEEPFVPIVREEYLYGRGTQDMKSGVAAFVCALRDFISQYSYELECASSFVFSILLTSDEEGSGTYGTKIVLEKLKKQNFLPDITIVAEPTCEERMGDIIKIGRRGSINGVIEIKGVQGHVAYPKKCQNPVEMLGSRLGDIAGVELDKGDEHFSPSKLVITDIRGGMEVVNVTPANLRIMFNVRNSTHTNLENVREYVEKVLEGLPFELSITQSSQPFLTNVNSCVAKLLSEAVSNVCGVTPKMGTHGGTSDARHFANFGLEVVEFGVRNDRIHSVDERVNIKDVEILYQVFYKMLEKIKGK